MFEALNWYFSYRRTKRRRNFILCEDHNYSEGQEIKRANESLFLMAFYCSDSGWKKLAGKFKD